MAITRWKRPASEWGQGSSGRTISRPWSRRSWPAWLPRVKLAKSAAEAKQLASKILGMQIKGLTVEKVLVTEAADIGTEAYVGIIVDRATKKPVFMVSAAGGIDIEEVAATTPEKIHYHPVDPRYGLLPFEAQQMGFFLYKDGESLTRQLDVVGERTLPLRWKRFSRVVPATVSSTVIGMTVIAVGEGLVLGVAYWIAGVPSPAAFGVLTGFLALIPGGAPVIFSLMTGFIVCIALLFTLSFSARRSNPSLHKSTAPPPKLTPGVQVPSA